MSQNPARRSRVVLDTEVFDRLVSERGWKNNAACARALNLHASTIARMRARTTSPTSDVMVHIAAVLGVPAAALFHQEEPS
jgi:transcriptional regulator with XRE-family HTH domain